MVTSTWSEKLRLFGSNLKPRLALTMMLIGVALSLAGVANASSPFNSLSYIPVQDGGRLKPFDTLARESLGLIYGDQTYHGRSATEVVMTWLIVPGEWNKIKFVKIDSPSVKKSLQLQKNRDYFSPEELLNNSRIGLVFSALQTKLQAKDKLNSYYQAVQSLESALGVYHQITLGNYIRVVPPKTGNTWLAVSQLKGDVAQKFQQVLVSFVHSIGNTMKMNVKSALPSAGPAAIPLSTAVAQFVALAKAQNPALYASAKRIKVEVLYNRLAPFHWAGLLYLLAFLFWCVWFFTKRKWFDYIAWVSMISAIGFHAAGFGFRMYLMGRPPVTNMYESVIWVSFVCVTFSLIFERIFRNRMSVLASSAVATLCLMVADMAPTILDPSLQPLRPVLRSNYWLIIHVMTITSGYAAFFLAFALGDVGLGYYLRGEKEHAKTIQTLSQLIYRVIQVGIVLLAAGTILGGIWADYSWGRFWGWDPKETWAFITIMGYIALLHCRIAGWIRSLGTIAGAVISFSLVMMAWYGVNYVLGAGLHSYGFGAGGVQYVSAFVAIHWVYVVFTIWYVRGVRLRESGA